jgi:hypothetical protein
MSSLMVYAYVGTLQYCNITVVPFYFVIKLNGDFFGLFLYFIQHSFLCRPSDSTVLEDAGIEPRTISSLSLTISRSNHSTRSHPTNRLHLVHNSARSHPNSARSHPHSARSHPQLG